MVGGSSTTSVFACTSRSATSVLGVIRRPRYLRSRRGQRCHPEQSRTWQRAGAGSGAALARDCRVASMSNKRTIVIAGALANKPHNGGNAWVVLNWVRGFQLLGFDVVFVEQLPPSACVDERGARCTFEMSAGRAFFREVIAWAGLQGAASLVSE